MKLSSALAGPAFVIGLAATGLGLATGAIAQPAYYPPQSPPQGYPPAQQAYPPYRPLPNAVVPDDDDDDIPPHQRAAPGNYPPPPGGYRGPFASSPRPQGTVPGTERDASVAPSYGRGPGVVYGDDRGPQRPYPAPPGSRNGQPESYGAAPGPGVVQPGPPPAYPPPQYGAAPAEQAPISLAPPQVIPAQPQGGPAQPRDATGSVRPNTVATLPPEEQPDDGKPELPAHLQRQLVQFQTPEPAGTLVVDTANTFLYLVLGNGQAMRYGIGVGREGFTWAGAERISRMKEWPDWYPPAEMIERQPYLPRMMAGGETNPLGARALYLGKTLYRIHGTNQPSTIGKYVSSGCIRLTNDDIQDLYSRVQVGTRVVVLTGNPPAQASNATPVPQQPVQR